MTTVSDKIVELLRYRNTVFSYHDKRLIFQGDRWKVFQGKGWDDCLYAGYNLDIALDELMAENNE